MTADVSGPAGNQDMHLNLVALDILATTRDAQVWLRKNQDATKFGSSGRVPFQGPTGCAAALSIGIRPAATKIA
jgi:hypothetical protein